MRDEILTKCGYRCDLCLAYRENVQKEDRRTLLSEGWYKYFGFRIEPEDIICDGCLNGDCQTSKLLDSGCPVRPCVTERGYRNCSECDEFVCAKLRERLVDFAEIKTKHGAISQTDRELFIRAYENKNRLASLRAKK